MKPNSWRASFLRLLPSGLVTEPSQEWVEQKCRHFRLTRKLFSSLLVCVLLFSNAAHADNNVEELHAAAVQRLHWSGLYLPEIEIIIGTDKVATVSGTVSSDVVKAEVVETVQMTDGIRGVINRLKVAP